MSIEPQRAESNSGTGQSQSLAKRAAPMVLDLSIVIVCAVALYLCAVVLPTVLDNTIVYRGF